MVGSSKKTPPNMKHAPLRVDERSEAIGHPSEADALKQGPGSRAWIKQVRAPHGFSSTQSDNPGRISSSVSMAVKSTIVPVL